MLSAPGEYRKYSRAYSMRKHRGMYILGENIRTHYINSRRYGPALSARKCHVIENIGTFSGHIIKLSRLYRPYYITPFSASGTLAPRRLRVSTTLVLTIVRPDYGMDCAICPGRVQEVLASRQHSASYRGMGKSGDFTDHITKTPFSASRSGGTEPALPLGR